MFLLVFQCQGCQGTPESFLIRREALSLRLDGRSPIETVEIPDYIPKAESKHYRDALLAMNTGRPLGAIFHLRTCIEQFARRITGIQAREPGDNLMAVYAANIPNDLSARMPSLREWYEKLSGGIHGAREDAELFCAALEAINKHFEVREVFKIPEAMSVAGRG